MHCLGLSQLFFQGEGSFNFMAAVTIPSNFGAQEKKIGHGFTFSQFFFFCHKVLGLEFMSVIFLDVYGVDIDPSYSHNSFLKK